MGNSDEEHGVCDNKLKSDSSPTLKAVVQIKISSKTPLNHCIVPIEPK